MKSRETEFDVEYEDISRKFLHEMYVIESKKDVKK